MYTYHTKSLDEFSVLLALGASIVKVERVTDSRFLTFYLKSDTINLEEKMLEFISRKLIINAYDLCDATRRAKTVIHRRDD